MDNETTRAAGAPGSVLSAAQAATPTTSAASGASAASSSELLPDDLASALAAVARAPGDEAAWDEAERRAALHQRPEEVAAAYRDALERKPPAELASVLGQRAVRFQNEWFDDPEPLVAILSRVLELDPAAAWAFERLSVQLTVGERWRELLDLYDRVLEAVSDDAGRRAALLTEAAHAAKDFAGEPGRAIRYLEELFAMRPSDAQVAASLERLLEREKRHEQLVAFWRARLDVLPDDAAQATRARIAACLLDHLGDPAAALEAALPLVDDAAQTAEACGLLERVAAHEGAPREARARALETLKRRYAADRRPEDVVRVLTLGLSLADAAERAPLHGAIAELCRELGREDDALEHLAAIVVLDPASERARADLREAAERTGRFDRYARALATAGDAASDDTALASRLFVEAAAVLRDRSGDEPGAIALHARVLGTPGVDRELLLEVARSQKTLLERAHREAELLDVLERLADLEPAPAERTRMLGEAARLAARQGDLERALAAWRTRLDGDPTDREALDAIVELLERAGHHEALVEALGRRAAQTTEPAARRADLVRIARLHDERLGSIDGSLDAWRAVEREFGRDAESVDALAALLERDRRWGDLADLLEQASSGEANPARKATLLHRLGDVNRAHLDAAASAAACYRAALRIDPKHAGAREGLVLLLDDAACKAEAAEALAEAYAVTDDWAGTISLLEHRHAVAPDDATRTRLLLEAATIEERRAGEPRKALALLRRAFALAPDDVRVEADVVRLAGSTGDFATAAAAYADAVAAAESKPRLAELRLRQGAMLEQRLGDLGGALEALEAMLAIDPARLDGAEAAVRVAARLGRWDDAASLFVRTAAAVDRVDPSLVSAIEGVAANDAGAWDAATTAFAAAEEAVSAALGAEAARALAMQIAAWHRDRRGAPDAAERVLQDAAAKFGATVPVLSMLADLQRLAPSRRLVTTLLDLANADHEPLASLKEAAEVALDAVRDAELARGILDRLLEQATAAWKGGDAEAEPHARWAIDRLVRIARDESDPARALALLVEGAALPFPLDVSKALLHDAAEIAATDLDDTDRAVELSRAILERDPADAGAIARLGALYDRNRRLDELLDLRRHQLGLATAVDERLALRLEIADIEGQLGRDAERLAAFRENLAERPGHGPSIDGVAAVLSSAARDAELCALLEEQAAALERLGESGARELWMRAADIAEATLRDLGRAIEALRRAAAIAEAPDAIDAIARLHGARGEHAESVEWLERRLALATDGERADVVARLARALLGAGRTDRARTMLEIELRSQPAARDLRDLLADIYRAERSFEPLVDLLASGAEHETDPETRLRYLREAATTRYRRLGDPAGALPILEAAVQLAPGDRPTRMMLADALRGAGQLDRAASILGALVGEYGRRRPPERGELHFQLAQVARARGDSAEAIAQLETAASMDVGHAGVLRMLGDLRRDAGELERAERAYRALLLLILRHRGDGTSGAAERDAGVPGPSEVMLELYRIDRKLGHAERAAEVLESAFDAAAEDDAEALRLEQALRSADEPELLLRALEQRLARTDAPAATAAILSEMAEVLGGPLGRQGEAFDARLRALEALPESDEARQAARRDAARAGATARYAAALDTLATGARDRGDAPLAATLLFELGEIAEQELEDVAAAKAALERAEATGAASLSVFRALDRVAGRLGDAPTQVRALRQLVTSVEDRDPAEQTEDIYRLARLELGSSQTIDAGVDTLVWAIEREPRYAEAAEMLRRAAEANPRHAGVLALYERLARAAGDDALLLDALERGAALPTVTMESLREAVELATCLGRDAQAEALLLRTVELTQVDGSATWALVALADRREAAGDLRAAVEWMTRAAELADAPEAQRLLGRVASLAAGPLDDLRLAADTYERLLDRDPQDRGAWEPLLAVLKRLDDPERLQARLASVAENVFDPAERNGLRLERAQLLLGLDGRNDDAIAALREILDDDPDHAEAARLLMDLCERTGRSDVLTELLRKNLDAARDHGDEAQVVAIALRLVSLLREERRGDAIEIARTALDFVPTSRELLEALLGLLTEPDDALERAGVLERLLAIETGPGAAKLAMDLAALRESLGDDWGAVRALEMGFKAYPAAEPVRSRLATMYEARESWIPLAEMRMAEASLEAEGELAVSHLRDAARILRERVGDARASAEALGRALALSPGDMSLLVDHARALADASETERAVQALTGALEARPDAPVADRVAILRVRAELHAGIGRVDLAVDDLELAFTLDPAGVASGLLAALERRREEAADRAETDVERACTLRLVAIESSAGDAARARAILCDWIQRQPDDAAALGLLLRIDAAAEQWDSVAAICARLVHIERGEAKVDAALHLADACARLGHPDHAREGLEAAFHEAPGDERIRNLLRELYERIGADRELAELAVLDAREAADDRTRFTHLRRAGQLLLRCEGEAPRAVSLLEQARQINAEDQETVVLLADAYVAAGMLAEATATIEAGIALHKGRRTRDVAALQHRMARVAYLTGDRNIELAWLNAALDSDKQNADVATELADVATELGQYEVALKALRSLTLMKNTSPATRAVAYLRQGMIAYQQGDTRRAVLMAKKAQTEDPELNEAHEFLQQIGG